MIRCRRADSGTASAHEALGVRRHPRRPHPLPVDLHLVGVAGVGLEPGDGDDRVVVPAHLERRRGAPEDRHRRGPVELHPHRRGGLPDVPEHGPENETHRVTAELHETRSVALVCHEKACRECSQRGVNQLYRVRGVAFDGSVAPALHGLNKLFPGSPATEFNGHLRCAVLRTISSILQMTRRGLTDDAGCTPRSSGGEFAASASRGPEKGPRVGAAGGVRGVMARPAQDGIVLQAACLRYVDDHTSGRWEPGAMRYQISESSCSTSCAERGRPRRGRRAPTTMRFRGE